jgi:hypothetical protein
MSLFRAVGGNKFKIVNGAAKVRVATSKVLTLMVLLIVIGILWVIGG